MVREENAVPSSLPPPYYPSTYPGGAQPPPPAYNPAAYYNAPPPPYSGGPGSSNGAGSGGGNISFPPYTNPPSAYSGGYGGAPPMQPPTMSLPYGSAYAHEPSLPYSNKPPGSTWSSQGGPSYGSTYGSSASTSSSPYNNAYSQTNYVPAPEDDHYLRGTDEEDGLARGKLCCGGPGDLDLERSIFVRNVLSIVCAQLLLVVAITCVFYFPPGVRYFVVAWSLPIWIASVVSEFVFLIALYCVRKNKVVGPIVLALFTLSSGVLTAMFACFFDLIEIVQAFGVTTVIVVVCCGYCIITRANFRWLGMILLVGSVLLLLFWLSSFLVLWLAPSHFRWLRQVLCFLGVVLFVGFLLYDMSCICNDYETDEHLIAAAALYLDIIGLFTYVLALFGGRSD